MVSITPTAKSHSPISTLLVVVVLTVVVHPDPVTEISSSLVEGGVVPTAKAPPHNFAPTARIVPCTRTILPYVVPGRFSPRKDNRSVCLVLLVRRSSPLDPPCLLYIFTLTNTVPCALTQTLTYTVTQPPSSNTPLSIHPHPLAFPIPP